MITVVWIPLTILPTRSMNPETVVIMHLWSAFFAVYRYLGRYYCGIIHFTSPAGSCSIRDFDVAKFNIMETLKVFAISIKLCQ